MFSVGGINVLNQAQGLFDKSSQRIAQGSTDPKDITGLLQAREQFAAGVKIAKVDDEVNKKLLDKIA